MTSEVETWTCVFFGFFYDAATRRTRYLLLIHVDCQCGKFNISTLVYVWYVCMILHYSISKQYVSLVLDRSTFQLCVLRISNTSMFHVSIRTALQYALCSSTQYVVLSVWRCLNTSNALEVLHSSSTLPTLSAICNFQHFRSTTQQQYAPNTFGDSSSIPNRMQVWVWGWTLITASREWRAFRKGSVRLYQHLSLFTTIHISYLYCCCRETLSALKNDHTLVRTQLSLCPSS